MVKKKRKYKKKIKPTPICGYCKKYKCKDGIEFGTTTCKDFKLVDIFLCEADGNRLHVEVCISRQVKGKCPKKCRQGKLIKFIYGEGNGKV